MLLFTASKNNYTAKTACWHYGCFHGSKPWFRFTDIEIEFEAFAEGNSCSHTQGFIRQKKLLLLLVYFFPPPPLPLLHLFNFLPPSLPSISRIEFLLLVSFSLKEKVGNRLFLLAPEGGRGRAQPGLWSFTHNRQKQDTTFEGKKALKALCHESELGERRGMPVWIVQWKIIQEEGPFHKKSLCALPELSLFPHFQIKKSHHALLCRIGAVGKKSNFRLSFIGAKKRNLRAFNVHCWVAGGARLRLRNLVIVLSLSFPLSPWRKRKRKEAGGFRYEDFFLAHLDVGNCASSWNNWRFLSHN